MLMRSVISQSIAIKLTADRSDTNCTNVAVLELRYQHALPVIYATKEVRLTQRLNIEEAGFFFFFLCKLW